MHDNLNPHWEAVVLPLDKLCDGDHDQPFYITFYDWEEDQHHQFMGHVTTTVSQILASAGKEAEPSPKRGLRRRKKSKKVPAFTLEVDGQNYGTIYVKDAQVVEQAKHQSRGLQQPRSVEFFETSKVRVMKGGKQVNYSAEEIQKEMLGIEVPLSTETESTTTTSTDTATTQNRTKGTVNEQAKDDGSEVPGIEATESGNFEVALDEQPDVTATTAGVAIPATTTQTEAVNEGTDNDGTDDLPFVDAVEEMSAVPPVDEKPEQTQEQIDPPTKVLTKPEPSNEPHTTSRTLERKMDPLPVPKQTNHMKEDTPAESTPVATTTRSVVTPALDSKPVTTLQEGQSADRGLDFTMSAAPVKETERTNDVDEHAAGSTNGVVTKSDEALTSVEKDTASAPTDTTRGGLDFSSLAAKVTTPSDVPTATDNEPSTNTAATTKTAAKSVPVENTSRSVFDFGGAFGGAANDERSEKQRRKDFAKSANQALMVMTMVGATAVFAVAALGKKASNRM